MSDNNGWIEYWNQDDFWGKLKLWDLNAKVFLQRAEGFVAFEPEDTVLNIGCGPGVLDLNLAGRVHSVLAVDAAANFVEMANEHFKNVPNIEARQMGEDYTDLAIFGRSFSLILCISVVQYYTGMNELEALIRSAQKNCVPGGRMLISDLNMKRNHRQFLWDAVCSLGLSFRDGYFFTLLRMAWKRWFEPSSYRQVYGHGALLEFSYEDLHSLIQRMGLDAQIIRRSFSIYANRPSLLIQF